MNRGDDRFRLRGRSSNHANWRDHNPSANQAPKLDVRRHQSTKSVKEIFQVDPDAKFLDDERVEGIRLLTDLDKIHHIQNRLGEFAHGPQDFFPVMWPVNATTNNIFKVTWKPYVVAPKPVGTRFLLYVDSIGDIFFENMAQNIFYVNKESAFKLFNAHQQPIINTVLDGVITREKSNNSDNGNEEGDNKPTERLTFVIHDATRYNGLDLTNMGILQRMAFVKKEIIMPRLTRKKAFENHDEKNEIFKLDMVEYKKVGLAKDYLSDEFRNHFKYPLRCLVFIPQHKGFECGTCQDVIYWAENDTAVFSYRLKISHPVEDQQQAELHAIGSNSTEVSFASIALTDNLRKLDGHIIDCHYDANQWIFLKVRHDRKHPNGLCSVLGKFEAVKNPVPRSLLLTTLKKCENHE